MLPSNFVQGKAFLLIWTTRLYLPSNSMVSFLRGYGELRNITAGDHGRILE
jgi:hypothetical protein